MVKRRKMPTFLALHCYKCNMMQAKHDKKSSNKWTCSLCNEKQSVRKVFAASMAAKDIRKYVQEYNFSRNSAQDLVLAELILNVEEERNAVFAYNDVLYGAALCGEISEARHDILPDKYSHPQVIVESKWNEYLPQNDGKYAEASEGIIDDARFVTVVPETYTKTAKGWVQSTPKNHNDPHPVQQKQRKENDFSSVPSEISVDAIQEKKDVTFAESQKVSLSSSLQWPKPPVSIQYGQRCPAYKVPQRIIPNVQMQADELLREGTLVPQSFKRVSSVATRKSVDLTEMRKPVSRYTCQEAFASGKQETHVSKWAKYMDSDEVMPAAKKAKLLDEPEPEPEPQGGSSVWSLRAASNMQRLNDGLVKTELDELMNSPGDFVGTPYTKGKGEIHFF